MQIFTRILFAFVGLTLLVYLVIPSPHFPKPPYDAVQSTELGDIEATSIKRAYFTNYSREEVLAHYQRKLLFLPWVHVPIPTYRLNYPPEDAFLLIRAHTRSTFLEEIVHPLRSFLFVNGFEPKDPKDEVWYRGIHYRQKITIKYKPSSPLTRLPIFVLSVLMLVVILKQLRESVAAIFKSCISKT